MKIALLTFPGHTFQTTLSVKSVIKFYQPESIYILVDDLASGNWKTYTQDLSLWLASCFPNTTFIFKLYSELDFEDCPAGWWRAQLIKLYSDKFIDGDEWLLIDGDIVFERVTPLKNITPYTCRTMGQDSAVAQLHANYVKRLLGIEQGHLTVNGEYVATSPVPFRVLSRTMLQGLRDLTESNHQGNLLKLHLQWFRDQTIIAYEDPPTRMIMSEWELIEGYRHYVLKEQLPMIEVGSGYPIDKQIDGWFPEPVVYKHSYQRELSIGKELFERQIGFIPNELWNTAAHWQTEYERNKR